MRVALTTSFGQVFDTRFAASNGLFGVRSLIVREGSIRYGDAAKTVLNRLRD
jgi:hypothetical protein